MSGIERTLAEVVVGIILLFGTVLYLEHRGAQACIQADKVAVTKQEAHNAAKGEVDAQTINEEALRFKGITAAPDPIDAPHVSLCHYSPIIVPSAKAPRPLLNAIPPSRVEDSPPARDVGPPLVKVGQESDAQVLALQDYIQRVCLVR